MPIIVDCDPGWDDCLTLLLLLAKDNFDVSITSVWGNEDVDATTLNARRMTYYCGRPDVPVFRGSSSDQAIKKGTIPSAALRSRVVEKLPARGMEGGTDAVSKLVEAANLYARDLTILAIGSMTNIAKAIQKDEAAMKTVGRLIVTGGTCKESRTDEFNLGADQGATDVLLAADLKPFIITFDTEMTMNCGKWAQDTLKGKKTKFADFYAAVIDDQLSQNNPEANDGVFDQLAVLFMLDENNFGWKQRTIRVEYPNGTIVDDSNRGHPARVVGDLDKKKIYDLMFSRLS
jgi:inosine-uridine nucleoside N-ribohydrolase